MAIAGTFVFAVLFDRRSFRRRSRWCRSSLSLRAQAVAASVEVSRLLELRWRLAWLASAREEPVQASGQRRLALWPPVLQQPAASISMNAAPTLIVSPSETRIFTILPADGLGTGIVALSVSSSKRS